MSDIDDGWADENADDSGDQGPTDKEIAAEIDRLLTIHRPERYDPAEKDWMEPVIDVIDKMMSKRMTAQQIVRDNATKRVRQREDKASGQINRILKNICETGQLPLGWGTDKWQEMFKAELRLPLSIRRERQGKTVGFVRIRLGSMTVPDWKEWETAFRRDSDRRRQAESRTADGGVTLRELMEELGVQRFDQFTERGGAAS